MLRIALLTIAAILAGMIAGWSLPNGTAVEAAAAVSGTPAPVHADRSVAVIPTAASPAFHAADEPRAAPEPSSASRAAWKRRQAKQREAATALRRESQRASRCSDDDDDEC
jgi:hypothetical protein